MSYGLRVFYFDELLGADEGLRRQARTLTEAAGDLAIDLPGLPPEGQAAVAGLAGLSARLEAAARELLAAATALGQAGADAQLADAAGWLVDLWQGLRGKAIPETGPLGFAPWVFGALAGGLGAAARLVRHRYGYPWVKHGHKWRINGSGPRLHPLMRPWAERAATAGKAGGAAATFAIALNRRLREGASVPRAVGGATGESGTVLACAGAGVRAGAAAPIPHPLAKGAVVVGGGIVGGAACTGPGRWVGDKASWVGGKVSDGVKKIFGG
jgi:hypothetical protein